MVAILLTFIACHLEVHLSCTNITAPPKDFIKIKFLYPRKFFGNYFYESSVNQMIVLLLLCNVFGFGLLRVSLSCMIVSLVNNKKIFCFRSKSLTCYPSTFGANTCKVIAIVLYTKLAFMPISSKRL